MLQDCVFKIFAHSLPIESGGGEMLVVEECVRGKKKEAVVQCALKACRILDSNDMLHPTSKGMLATFCCVCVHTRIHTVRN